MPKVDILGVKIDNVTMDEAVSRVEEMLTDGKKHQVVTPNPEFVMLAQKDVEFREILNEADLAIPDGIGLLATAKYLSMRSTSIPILRELQKVIQGIWVGFCVLFNRRALNVISEQVAGVDLVWNLAGLAERKGYSFYLLGGSRGVAQKAKDVLSAFFVPKLKVVGAEEGRVADLDFNGRKRIDQEIVERINKVEPDILLVAFGAPKQEKWIARYLPQLNVRVAIGVGGTFDYLIRKPARASGFFQKKGLEWLWRLFVQPWRLPRILIAFPIFPLTVAWHRLKMV